MSGLRVAVVGAYGRMGSTTCAAVEQDGDLDLVARVGAGDPLEAVVEARADVAVEFTTPATVRDNAQWLLEHGVHTVVGASGLSDDDLAALRRATGAADFAEPGSTEHAVDRLRRTANCLVVPNFAIGAVLMMRAAEQIAVHLPDVEIIEAHHRGKVDAPSGTALATAARIAAARARRADVPGPAGHPARGLVSDDVPVHSMRLPGVVASQSVVFGGTGQTLTIRHDSIDRSSFMPGVLLAVKAVADRPGLTVGLDALL
ncbi:MAG TPA: 4-hydroxy-tetrahydrodipicolinate reductase [Euzebyales bacterium]|nr:4-hydroxy-tetrahydrodipicolinate reductase [Euzebyales bacterium]